MHIHILSLSSSVHRMVLYSTQLIRSLPFPRHVKPATMKTWTPTNTPCWNTAHYLTRALEGSLYSRSLVGPPAVTVTLSWITHTKNSSRVHRAKGRGDSVPMTWTPKDCTLLWITQRQSTQLWNRNQGMRPWYPTHWTTHAFRLDRTSAMTTSV
jgi:hypothetical protein